ncbi:hypothetical protein JK636_15700 [Clostridium sp. YIM B02515]|uniref:Uncharacterized protein n=1 Tax=Clostridium rhizosphaerae TaxID=2803861 RepID=A0ABS1TCT4_9CLOT|nr:hypothetical protein [Clostridium rhizosphaerae]MBL4937172.1 hypothetical protein [Clostridium rhizosphaerae]
MLLTLEILGLLTMITVIFVLVWGFIILNQIFGQLRYKNYLMEKLIETIYNTSKIVPKEETASSHEADIIE